MLIDTVQELIKSHTQINSFHGIPVILKRFVGKNSYYIINIKFLPNILDNFKSVVFTDDISCLQHSFFLNTYFI